MSLVEIRNVSAGYGGVKVITDVSLTVREGERVSIIGPNGCGKTTLLKAICKLIPLMDGNIKVRGESIRTIDRRKLATTISMMAQISEQWFDFTVLDTVLMGRYSHRRGVLATSTSADLRVAEECLRTVGLLDCAYDSITCLSGGQRQRLMLARAFAQEPVIIVLDEPTNHLDLKHQAELFEHLRRWVSQPGRAVIQVMHDLNLARMYSDRVPLMSGGRLIAEGSPDDVLSTPVLDDTYGYGIRQFMKKSLRLWEDNADD
ncbi:MAG: ABC transporter ATP-binding protein [Gracilibacteraceae bacterium]|jgi:iron complex transport system ATP-binding protein|nr:ABC transporter ATP-binding protein [Gracilibacteraceae bacterium]